jgi:DNA topoisomerase-2
MSSLKVVSSKKVASQTPVTTESAALAQQYQQKTDKQHILDNPDTYIGSVENVVASLWVYDEC